MDFEKAVSLVSTVTDLRRIASAHVIDHLLQGHATNAGSSGTFPRNPS